MVDASVLGDGATSVVDSGTTPSDGSTPTGDAGDASTIVLQKVIETKLVADTDAAGAPTVDPALVNSWGLAFNPSGPAWIADNGTGELTVWNGQVLGLLVTVPPPGDAAGPAAPSGLIFNAAHATTFDGDLFIVATEDGTVSGWQPIDGSTPTTATLRIDNSGSNAVYKGLAILPTTPALLAVADFHNNKISLFDTSYNPVAPASDASTVWTDPSVPSGYAPFNIVTIGSSVYVAFAKQDAAMHDGLLAPGDGALSVFTPTGTLVKSLVAANGPLSSPWGMVMAPAGWGSLGGSLLVGNFGGGAINAFQSDDRRADRPARRLHRIADPDRRPLGPRVQPRRQRGRRHHDDPALLHLGPNAEMNGLFGYLTPSP
jgi:uncharacterized protein (TIGR03118 family)